MSECVGERRGVIKCVSLLIVLLFAIGMLFAPSVVAKDEDQGLKNLNKLLKEADDTTALNNFAYQRMVEYDNSPETTNLTAVKVMVKDGRWWWSKDVTTFYVVRNDTGHCIDIRDTYGGDDSGLWTFYPNVGQTIDALHILIRCFADCEYTSTYEKARTFIKLGIIGIRIDKSENVPSITDIISRSPWLDDNLPSWAKDFLESFEQRH